MLTESKRLQMLILGCRTKVFLRCSQIVYRSSIRFAMDRLNTSDLLGNRAVKSAHSVQGSVEFGGQQMSPVLWLFCLIILVMYAAAGEWALVQHGWLKLDPAFLFLIIAFVFILLALPANARTDLESKSPLAKIGQQQKALIPFGFMVLASLLFSFDTNAYWGQGGKYIFAITYDFHVFVFAIYFGMRVYGISGYRLLLLVTQGILAVSVWGDLAVPELFNPDPLRPGGIAINPNRAAFMVCLLTSLTIRYDKVRWFDLIWLALSGSTVLATMSRAGLIYFASVFVMYVFFVAKNNSVKMSKLIFGFIIFLSCIGFLYSAIGYMLRSEMILGQGITNTHLKMFMGDVEFEWLDPVRLDLITTGISTFLDAPLMGNGTGFSQTQELGWHNTYLRMAVDNGIGGLVCYLWFLGACISLFLKRSYQPGLVFIGVWVLEGLFNHSLIDNRGGLLLLGLALVQSTETKLPKAEVLIRSSQIARAVQ